MWRMTGKLDQKYIACYSMTFDVFQWELDPEPSLEDRPLEARLRAQSERRSLGGRSTDLSERMDLGDDIPMGVGVGTNRDVTSMTSPAGVGTYMDEVLDQGRIPTPDPTALFTNPVRSPQRPAQGMGTELLLSQRELKRTRIPNYHEKTETSLQDSSWYVPS